MDSEGTLYGITQGGPGNSGCGTVFKINKNVETILHVFACSGSEGYLPTAGVVLDSAGNSTERRLSEGPDVVRNADRIQDRYERTLHCASITSRAKRLGTSRLRRAWGRRPS